MRVAILTSSRADYGIYLPLIKKLHKDSFFSLEIVAFGTHLSKYHGYTIEAIKELEGVKIHEISSLLTNDDQVSISTAYGLTVVKFAEFWKLNAYDSVFCLGDRYEMSAAVQAGIPFGVKFFHLHGGETTLGAIDNIYRHQISLAAKVHLTATKAFSRKVSEIIGSDKNIYDVGALSLDGLSDITIPNRDEFCSSFTINREFVLVTFHPETNNPEVNFSNTIKMKNFLSQISQEILVVATMPNADTMGTTIRQGLVELQIGFPDRFLLIENFGKINYFAAMTYCKLMIGNTSSGIIEAATFRKFVINVGGRQDGRVQSENIINTSFDPHDVLKAYSKLKNLGEFTGENVYKKEGTADFILKLLKQAYHG